MDRLKVVALVLAIAGIWPGLAHGNGRYPSADQVLTQPGDSTHLVLRATFGMLFSDDAGRSWNWVCENAVGYGAGRDPALAVFQDGNVAAGFARSLRISHDNGCDWTSPFRAATTENFIDATSDPGDPSRVLFLSRSLGADHLLHVFEANGSSLAPLEGPLGDDLSPITLEVAPSLPSRLYVTAFAADLTTVLMRSDDRGKTWRRLPIHPDETLPAYIAAVDPTNPDRLYLRLDGNATDILLVSDDGGVTFEEALSLATDLLGFALSPDGTALAVGGPTAGIFLAESTRRVFKESPAAIRSLSCLKWTAEGLLACARESSDGFTIARSEDGGETFVPLFHLADLKPRSCGAESAVGAQCPAFWPSVAQSLGIDPGAANGTGVANEAGAAGRNGGCSLLPAWRGNLAPSAVLALLAASLLRRRSARNSARKTRAARPRDLC